MAIVVVPVTAVAVVVVAVVAKTMPAFRFVQTLAAGTAIVVVH